MTDPLTSRRLDKLAHLISLPSFLNSRPSSHMKAKKSTPTIGMKYYNMQRKDGRLALAHWRDVLSYPFIVEDPELVSMIVPHTLQQYSHSFLKPTNHHQVIGCGFRFLSHATYTRSASSSSSSISRGPWSDIPSGRDQTSARLMVKAVHSENSHFDDESSYREIKV